MVSPRQTKRGAKEATQAIENYARDLSKEQQEWKVKRSTIKRELVQLRSEADVLERQNKEAHVDLDSVRAEVALAKITAKELDDKNTSLEVENHRLEDELERTSSELDVVKSDLLAREASVSSELEAYALEKKQAIKAEILAVNAELEPLREELKTASARLEQKRSELVELNQVYIDEQDELKASSAETKRMIAENETRKIDLQAQIDELTEKNQKLQYDYDNMSAALTKAREEHDKFIEYEKSARKILATKDKQLQERAADIATQGQFVKNQRSFLPEM